MSLPAPNPTAEHRENLPDEAPPAGHLSVRTKVGWGVGALSESLMASCLYGLALPIYNIGLGVDAVWLGWGMFIPRVIDALIDPWLGNLSDNTRTRWGRRRPWIAAGALASAVTFAAVWLPPLHWGQRAIFIYFLVGSIAYYISMGLFSISYNALGLELSEDYHERTSVQAYRFFFISLAAIGLGWVYKLSFLPFFAGDPVPGIKTEVLGIRSLGILLGAFLLVSGLMPVLLCRERLAAIHQPTVPILQAMALTLRNRVFLLFMSLVMVTLFGQALVGPLATYINIYHVYQGDKSLAATLIAWCALASGAAAIAATPLINLISRRWGKRRTLIIGQGLIALSTLSSWFLFTPAMPYLAILPSVLMTVGIGCFQILYGSILAEICDVDELKTGLRREGMYGAVGAFLTKVVFASTTVLGGYILSVSGFSPSHDPSSSTLSALRLFFALLPTAFVFAGFLLVRAFPLTQAASAEIRRKLEARQAERRVGSVSA